jgi:hypothetical protein
MYEFYLSVVVLLQNLYFSHSMADSLNPDYVHYNCKDTWHGTHKSRVWTLWYLFRLNYSHILASRFLAPPAAPSTSSKPLTEEKVTAHGSASVTEIAHAGTIRRREEDAGVPQEGEPPTKKPKLSGAQRKKLAKEAKQKQRGQNKARRFLRISDEVDVCWKVACSLPCEAPYVSKFYSRNQENKQ